MGKRIVGGGGGTCWKWETRGLRFGMLSPHALHEALSAVFIRECLCGSRFFKEDGCNSMACVCGQRMCYLCRQPIVDYAHFCQCSSREAACPSCHLYADAQQVDAAAMAAMELQFQEGTGVSIDGGCQLHSKALQGSET